jgi:hypothetical protein
MCPVPDNSLKPDKFSQQLEKIPCPERPGRPV